MKYEMEYTVLCKTFDPQTFSESRTGWFGRGKESFIDGAEKIHIFINSALRNCGYGSLSINERDILEMVKNSFDAFMQKGLRPFTILRLKVTVTNEKIPNSIVIKIKDNGAGFHGARHSESFERDQLARVRKPFSAFGGMGWGISQFENRVKSLGGRVYFKNRKDEGAYVGVVFGWPGSKIEGDAEELLFQDAHF